MDADVIVVGSGPAGAAAACGLARGGLDVLLLDRQEFPRDKTCGDGIPPGSVEILESLGMGDKIRAAGFHQVEGIRLGSPAGRVWDAAFRPRRGRSGFLIAPRAEFDALIHDHAIESGARFLRAAVRAPVLEDGRVTGVRAVVGGRDTELTARIVVGADGATSAIARALRAGSKPSARHRSVAIRAYLDGIETLPGRIEFYFYRRLLPGYGWVFPLGPDRANVGVIVRADRYRESGDSLDGLLEEFLDSPAVRGRLRTGHRIEKTASWQLPNATAGPLQNTFDGAVLAGDAASLVDPLTGEGIHSALVSAVCASEAIAAAIGTGDVSAAGLSIYDRMCGERLGSLFRRSARVQGWLDGSPWWVELLFSLAAALPRQTEWFINRASSDFVVRVDQ